MRAGAGGGLELSTARWGFLPTWASKSKPQINARAETVGVKPMFCAAFKNGRCLVPAAGWYQWTTIGGESWPYYISRRDGELFCFAGIEARGAKGERNHAIITSSASDDLRWLHNRMPVVLEREAQERWLTETGRGRVRAMLQPAAEGMFSVVRVSKRVNLPENDNAQLIEPVE